MRVLPGLPLSLLVGSAARPFGHSGALQTGGAVSLMCGSVRRLGARPGPAALQSCFVNFACNSLFAISKFEFMSLGLQRFWALLKVYSIELHAKFGEGHVVGVRWGVGARNCSPCSSCWWRKRYKVLPARVVGGGSGTKFSLHAKSGPKSAFWGLLGEFCTGWACQGRLLGEFCTGWAAEPGVLGEFCTGYGAARSCRMNSGSSRTWRKFVDGRRA